MLSPRELAEALGVSESSLKRWVDSGKLHAARTEGGHRRISVAEALRFIRENGAPVARPELLHMPEVAQTGDRSASTLLTHLQRGDARAARGWVLARYLEGEPIGALCDGPIKNAMHAIGERWKHDADGVFVEHRATDACIQALAHLRSTFDPPANAPVALGATPEDDPYLLPSFMCATVIAAEGMRAVNLGPDTPVSAMQQAYEHAHPRLVWLSASSPVAPARARAIARWLGSLPARTTVAVGGRQCGAIVAADPKLRRLDSMTELAELTRTLLTKPHP